MPAFAAETVTVTASENMTAVYKAEAVDTDIGSSVSYTLAGADAGLFDIAADGTVTFKAAPDFEGVGTDDNPGSAEGTNTYSFTVVADDGMGKGLRAGGHRQCCRYPRDCGHNKPLLRYFGRQRRERLA